MHWSEEVILEGEGDNLLEESIAHEELLGSTADVSVSVHQSHAGEPGLLHLEGNAFGQVQVDLGLSLVDSRVRGSGENVEAPVSDFVDHFIQ